MTLAKLYINGQERELFYVKTKYNRKTRDNGKPKSEVMGGLITGRFISQADDDIFLRWMTKESEDNTWEEVDKMQDGEIHFYDNGYDYPPTKIWIIKDSHLIAYKETFHNDGEKPMQVEFVISAAIQDYGALLVKRWNVSFVPEGEETVYKQTQNSNIIISDVYYEDLNGKVIYNPVIGTEIYIVIKSQNILGKKTTIDLSDKKKDFIYKEQVLENDILKNITINNDIQKERLTVIAQNH
ncbi:hypothetical protein A8C32_09935 [Flavivirga aquatica]|uniref:Uncharacterized protein n=1 Tax=Flavivirga aquatica TaxID=1849968 RepID=A0A1E5TEN3_9FLAO|nr:type VI secretion system tube protein TssD [Flavivirga aquatica]OEK09821.1 hypothetical protein A8C32_09935 [Flavivirga aquatica]